MSKLNPCFKMIVPYFVKVYLLNIFESSLQDIFIISFDPCILAFKSVWFNACLLRKLVKVLLNAMYVYIYNSCWLSLTILTSWHDHIWLYGAHNIKCLVHTVISKLKSRSRYFNLAFLFCWWSNQILHLFVYFFFSLIKRLYGVIWLFTQITSNFNESSFSNL